MKNFFLVEKFSSKNANWSYKSSIWGNFKGKIKLQSFLSENSLSEICNYCLSKFCRKFPVSVGNFHFMPAYFFSLTTLLRWVHAKAKPKFLKVNPTGASIKKLPTTQKDVNRDNMRLSQTFAYIPISRL